MASWNVLLAWLKMHGGKADDLIWRAAVPAPDTLEAFKRGAQTVTTNCAKKLFDEFSRRGH